MPPVRTWLRSAESLGPPPSSGAGLRLLLPRPPPMSQGVFSVLDPQWRPAYGDRKAFQRLASQIGVGLGYRDDYGPLVDRVLRWNTVERAGRRPGDLLLRTYP